MVIRCDLSRACRLRYADDRCWDGPFLAALGAGVAPRVPIGCLSNLLVSCHKCSRIMVLQTRPSRRPLRSSPPYRTLEASSVLRPAFRHSSTLITTTHSVIIVGKMMVAILVNPIDSPIYACTRPTGTEPTPATTTTHPSHPGYSPLEATASPSRMKVTPAKRMLNREARAKLMASSATTTRRAAAA